MNIENSAFKTGLRGGTQEGDPSRSVVAFNSRYSRRTNLTGWVVQGVGVGGGGGGENEGDSAEIHFQSFLQETTKQFWHGKVCPLFDVVHSAFPLPTTEARDLFAMRLDRSAVYERQAITIKRRGRVDEINVGRIKRSITLSLGQCKSI